MRYRCPTADYLPPLPFGDTAASEGASFNTFRDAAATMLPKVRAVDSAGNRAAFRWKACQVQINGLRLSACVHTPATMSVGESSPTIVTVNFSGDKEFTIGRSRFRLTGGRGAVFMPGMPRRSDSDNVNCGVAIELDPARLESTARAILGLGRDAPVNLRLTEERVLRLDQRGISFDVVFRSLWRTIDTLRHQPSVLALQAIDDQFYRAITIMLRPELFMSESSPRHASSRTLVDEACDYIDANLTAPISLTDLEQVTGMKARSLQLAFRKERGCTPLDWLRKQRLEMVRQRLLCAARDAKVHEIALAYGFSDGGRFARLYAALFGELPSQTFARRKG